MINYTDPTPLDVVATHMCNNGYELVGGSTRSCFIVGCCNSWNEGVITCSRKEALYDILTECTTW